MKKIFICLLLIISLIPGVIFASSVSADSKKVRDESNNYGVSKKWDMSSQTRINHAMNTPYVDASQKIYDYSNVLSEDEEKTLKKEIDNFIEKTKFDLVFVSVDLPYSLDSVNEDYAADFYDYNDFGLNDKYYSGVLLLRNTYENDPYYNIYTFGSAQLYFSYDRLENILDEIYPKFKNGVDYKGGIETFIHKLKVYYDKGIPDEMKYSKLDEYGNVYETYRPPYFIAFLVSIISSIIIIVVMINKNKMVRKATTAFNYLDKDSIKYNKKSDTYLRSHTTSYKTSSSSGGSGGGHSSGSSGGGHSSGGGRHG